MLFVASLLTVITWSLNLISLMMILIALLSWLNPQSQAVPHLYQITTPLLDPLWRVLPQLDGIGLSPILRCSRSCRRC
ncbi:UNVERIFIED_ORG: uncharacterized protein YggT (Ycf19 family) [Burkholderia sp. 1595]|uniref:Uncharacterized protein YggT (Ycf19 family) n=1 Tax=Paraburkholderia terricola TaxID=169427 RepID=A0ABU1LZT4_9BURK|nr:YggT family protein [Paraburkholderia terricola]MDR6412251.1 uncharacterized protein YggT (Ycf19 family) [Paraburkholderia terricola]